MEIIRTKKSLKSPTTYICEKCSFVSVSKKDYNRHLLTRKHIRETNGTIIPPSSFVCDNCSKQFNTRSGLWKHRNKCKVIESEESQVEPISQSVDSSLVIELLKQNQEFKEM